MISYHIVNPTQILETPSVVATALAKGHPATGRSFRLHRPRAGYCGAGWCDQCGVDISSGLPLCQTPAGTARSSNRDPLRAIGFAAERQAPWFWEHRLLWPPQLRGTYLNILRHLSSAPALPIPPPGPRPSHRRLDVDILHVGDPDHADPHAFVVDAGANQLAFGVYDGHTVGVICPGEVIEIHCERLVLATGAYLRLPPILGNDLPGVMAVDALQHYAEQGVDLSALRVSITAPADQLDQLTKQLADRVRIVDYSSEIPQEITGRGRVQGVRRGEHKIACDVAAFALDQPAIELALLAGATGYLSDAPLPVVLAGELPDWVELRGRAAGLPANAGCVSHPEAFACPCEDVRFRDLARAVSSGLDDVELIKRRTGAMTGPCQGKLCQGAVLTALRDLGIAPSPITPRPFAQMTRLADLACGHDS